MPGALLIQVKRANFDQYTWIWW